MPAPEPLSKGAMAEAGPSMAGDGLELRIRGCRSRADFHAALNAVLGYLERLDFPQHSRIGKATAGIAVSGGEKFLVWRTASGWSVERVDG